MTKEHQPWPSGWLGLQSDQEEKGKKVTVLVHTNDVAGKHSCLQVSNYILLEPREDFKKPHTVQFKLSEHL